MSTTRRTRFAAAILATTSAIVTLLIVEGLSRILFPGWAPQTARLASFWRYDPAYGWSHNPGQRGRFSAGGFETAVRINNLGFRGHEIALGKQPGTRNVIVLGDSLVWGFGVEEEETFTHLLDEQLKPVTRVINLGVSGYSTDQELLLYRDLGRRLAPDVVVLVFANNDVATNALSVAYGTYAKPLFTLSGDELTLTNQPVPQMPWYRRVAVNIASHSYVVSQFNRVRHEWTRARPSRPASEGRWGDLPFPRNYSERLTLRLIDQVRAEVEADGARFILLLVDRAYHGRSFRLALKELGIEVVALDDYTAGVSSGIHIMDELHWNPAGHELVARALLPQLRH